MFSVNVLHRVRTDSGWVRVPVRKTPQGKFVWDRSQSGVYYLEWYEDGKRRRATAGVTPSEVLEARRRKILVAQPAQHHHRRSQGLCRIARARWPVQSGSSFVGGKNSWACDRSIDAERTHSSRLD